MGNHCNCSEFEEMSSESNIIKNQENLQNNKVDKTQLIQNQGNHIDEIDQKTSNEDTSQEIQQQEIKAKFHSDKKKKFIAKENEQIFEKIEKCQHQLNEMEKSVIMKSLLAHSLFSLFDKKDLSNIIDLMFYCKVQKDSVIFNQGDKASSFFVIYKGEIQVLIENKLKIVLVEGNSFGELALLYNAPRSATVKTSENQEAELFGIDRATFKHYQCQISNQKYDENLQFMKKVNFFQHLTPERQSSLIQVIKTLQIDQDQYVFHQGDEAQAFFLIKEGYASIEKDGKEFKILEKGDHFGELALFYNTSRSCSVKAVKQTLTLLSIGKEDVKNIFGDQLQKITYLDQTRYQFLNNEYLCKFTHLQIEQILESLTLTQYEEKSLLLPKNAQIDNLYIILAGELRYGTDIITNIFGIQQLIKENIENLKFNLEVSKSGIIGKIPFKNIYQQIGDSWNQMIKKNELSHEKLIYLQQEKISSYYSLQDLKFIKKLGTGSFGQVYLVSSPNNQLFAIKCQSKKKIIEQKLESNLIQEKKVMELLVSPFIVTFDKSFKDQNYIYFLMEFINGIEFFDAIRQIGLLQPSESKFYISQIIFMLEYLHSRNIIYRDLKPENLMVDKYGYLKLIDMGTGKILQNQNSRTFTMLGTPHYLAPEVLTAKGYSFHVDFWSMGYYPYGNDTDDPYDIYEQILQSKIIFPSFIREKQLKKFILQLLNKIPEARMGGSFAALKANPWFGKNFEWVIFLTSLIQIIKDEIYHKRKKAQYVPKELLIQEKFIQQQMDGKQPKEFQRQLQIKSQIQNWDEIF